MWLLISVPSNKRSNSKEWHYAKWIWQSTPNMQILFIWIRMPIRWVQIFSLKYEWNWRARTMQTDIYWCKNNRCSLKSKVCCCRIGWSRLLNWREFLFSVLVLAFHMVHIIGHHHRNDTIEKTCKSNNIRSREYRSLASWRRMARHIILHYRILTLMKLN